MAILSFIVNTAAKYANLIVGALLVIAVVAVVLRANGALFSQKLVLGPVPEGQTVAIPAELPDSAVGVFKAAQEGDCTVEADASATVLAARGTNLAVNWHIVEKDPCPGVAKVLEVYA
jgi:hypothetical protein